eukprot:4092154-Lingulodinium_polyedra.AAC.1
MKKVVDEAARAPKKISTKGRAAKAKGAKAPSLNEPADLVGVRKAREYLPPAATWVWKLYKDPANL